MMGKDDFNNDNDNMTQKMADNYILNDKLVEKEMQPIKNYGAKRRQ